MGLYQKLLWPAFRSMEPEAAHDRIVQMLRLAQSNPLGRSVLRSIAGKLPAQPVKAFGLTFPNVIGVAAGFDKNVRVAPGLGELGFGHVEVGTLTPRPQQGNPRPRVFRLLEDEAVINRMGFPNCGVENALPRLKRMSPATRTWVLGVSLGKQKETPLTEAVQDYVTVMREVYVAADYLAVNISSPNTPDLRDLQHDAYLDGLLAALVAERNDLAERHRTKARPLLLKIAPDLTHAELDGILNAALRHGIDGLIATNTTLSRDGARSPLTRETGGLSGKPLAGRSTSIIAHAHRHAGEKLPIIGVGGVLDPADAREKLDAGAVLVQIYTGMVYRGPAIAGNIVRGVAESQTERKRG